MIESPQELADHVLFNPNGLSSYINGYYRARRGIEDPAVTFLAPEFVRGYIELLENRGVPKDVREALATHGLREWADHRSLPPATPESLLEQVRHPDWPRIEQHQEAILPCTTPIDYSLAMAVNGMHTTESPNTVMGRFQGLRQAAITAVQYITSLGRL